MRHWIDAATDLLRANLPGDLQWVASLVHRTLEYLCGPFLEDGGRFPWWAVLAAIAIAAYMFYFSKDKPRDRSWRRFALFCFPPRIYLSKTMWVDIKVGFVNWFIQPSLNVTWRMTTAAVASWITELLTNLFGPPVGDTAWGAAEILVFAVGLSMASDFGYFLFHRLSHAFPPLWAIHKLHHSAEVLSPLTAARVHPLEHAIMGPFMALTTGIIVGPLLYMHGGIATIPLVFGLSLPGALFFLFGHLLHHSHVWVYFGPILGRIIVSPAQHQIHHSSLPHHVDRNFAEHWAVWDALFGTIYLPKGREHMEFGVTGYTSQPHPGLLAACFRPIWEVCGGVLFIARRHIAHRIIPK